MLSALGDDTGLSRTDPSTHVHGELHRARIDLAKKQLRSAPLRDGHCAYPRIAKQVAGGRRQRIWLQSSRYVDGVMHFHISRIDEDGALHHHTFAPGELCSEPALAQRHDGGQGGREDDGSVLTLVYDRHTARSHVVVLDARTPTPLGPRAVDPGDSADVPWQLVADGGTTQLTWIRPAGAMPRRDNPTPPARRPADGERRCARVPFRRLPRCRSASGR